MAFPATEAEFWAWLAECNYPAEFHRQHFIPMSYENRVHSQLAIWLGHLLIGLFGQQVDIHGANRPVYANTCGSVFNPDVSVVRKDSPLYEYRPGMAAETEPVLIIEVLSKTTRGHDLAEKLPCYKQIPGLQQIIYLDSERCFATVYDRIDQSDRWLNIDYHRAEDEFSINGQALSLKKIYERVSLG